MINRARKRVEGTESANVIECAVMLPSEGCLLGLEGLMGVSSFGYAGTNSHVLLSSNNAATSWMWLQQAVQYQQTAFEWWGSSVATEALALLRWLKLHCSCHRIAAAQIVPILLLHALRLNICVPLCTQ